MKSFKTKACAVLMGSLFGANVMAFDAKPSGYDKQAQPAPNASAAPAVATPQSPVRKPWEEKGPWIAADTMALSDEQIDLMALRAAAGADTATFEQLLTSGRLKVGHDGKKWCADAGFFAPVAYSGQSDLRGSEFASAEEMIAKGAFVGIAAPASCAKAALMMAAMEKLDPNVRGEAGVLAKSLGNGRRVWSAVPVPANEGEFAAREQKDKDARKIIADIDANLADGEKRTYATYARHAFANGDVDMGMWFVDKYRKASQAAPTAAWAAFDKAAAAKDPADPFFVRKLTDLEGFGVALYGPAGAKKGARENGRFFWAYAAPLSPWAGRGASLAAWVFVEGNMVERLGNSIHGYNNAEGAKRRDESLYVHASDLASSGPKQEVRIGGISCEDSRGPHSNPESTDPMRLERARLITAYRELLSDPSFDPNLADSQGNTLLHAIATKAKKEGELGPLARDLIMRGADFTKVNKAGKTPQALAEEGRQAPDMIAAFRMKPEEYDKLRFKGACSAFAKSR